MRAKSGGSRRGRYRRPGEIRRPPLFGPWVPRAECERYRAGARVRLPILRMRDWLSRSHNGAQNPGERHAPLYRAVRRHRADRIAWKVEWSRYLDILQQHPHVVVDNQGIMPTRTDLLQGTL